VNVERCQDNGFIQVGWQDGRQSIWDMWILPIVTLNAQHHFSVKKHSKLLVLLHSPPKREKYIFIESNCRILYFTCLRSYGKNFMRFDCTDWKILAFKVGKNVFLMLACNFRWLWHPFVEFFCTTNFELKKNCVEELSWKSRIIFFLNAWFSFFKKSLCRSRSKIERKTKSL